MIDFTVILFSLLTMLLLMCVGFLLQKRNMTDERFSANLSTLVLYIAMPCMIVNAFLRDYDPSLLSMMLQVFLIALIAHTLLALLAFICFRKTPEKKRSVLRYMIIFSNCAFMGFPVLSSIFPEQSATAILLGACFQVWFNLFTWTLGVRLYQSENKLRLRRLFLNPGTIAVLIGMLLFLTGARAVLPSFIPNTLQMLGNLVTPLSMIVVGISLSKIRPRDLFCDRSLLCACALRQIITPAFFFAVYFLLRTLGIYVPDTLVISVPFILLCMPAATTAVMMAQQFGGDAVYASTGVTLSTLTSVITIPLMSLLLGL